MSRKYTVLFGGLAAGLTLTLVVLAGCGGGGGPIAPPTPETPKPNQAFLDLLPAAQASATYVGAARCKTCHDGTNPDAPLVDFAAFALTKHSQIKVECEMCHGPASVHVAGPSEDNILTYPNVTRSAVCAQCHGPMAAQYEASPHAEVVEDAVTGGRQPCMRCHSAPTRVEYVEEAKRKGKTRAEIDATLNTLPAAEVTKLVEGTHESSSCTVCHDPMHTTTNLTPEGKQAQLRRSTDLAVTTDIDPGVTQVNYVDANHVCGTCHNGRGGNGADASIKTASRPSIHDSPQMNMLLGISGSELPTAPLVRRTAHASAPGQCIHCHMPSADHTMTVKLDVSCSPCHSAADAAARYALRGVIANRLLTIKARFEAYALAKFGDKDLWDYTALLAVGKDTTKNALLPIEFKRARHNWYMVVRDLSWGIHNSTYTRYLLDTAETNLDASKAAKVASRATLTVDQVKAVLAPVLARAKAQGGKDL